MRRLLLLLTAVLFLGCQSPTEPEEDPAGPRGRLAGTVTIGPHCPASHPGFPCPVSPSAFSQRKILIENEDRTRTLHTVDIDSRGFYLIDLVPATYSVNFRGTGSDSSKDLPTMVTIRANVVTTLNVNIDTGIR